MLFRFFIRATVDLPTWLASPDSQESLVRDTPRQVKQVPCMRWRLNINHFNDDKFGRDDESGLCCKFAFNHSMIDIRYRSPVKIYGCSENAKSMLPVAHRAILYS